MKTTIKNINMLCLDSRCIMTVSTGMSWCGSRQINFSDEGIEGI